MQVSSTALDAYMVELAKSNYHSFTDLVSNVTLGLYESFAPPKQGVCRQLFLKQRREIEKQTNNLCVEKTEALMKSQMEKEANVKLRSENPDRFLEQSLREIVHLEQTLVDEELRKLRGKNDVGQVRLKLNDATFVSHRWLESILNSEGLEGEARAAFHRKILDEPGDYEIFTSNLGYDGEGSNRSAFGIFTEYALKALKTEAESTLQRAGIVYKKQDKRSGYWKISKGRDLLKTEAKKLTTDDRILLIMNGLYQTFGSLQCLRGASLENILKILTPEKAGGRKAARSELPQEVSQSFDEYERSVESIASRLSQALPKLSHESLQTLESFREIFFFQSKLLYHDIKNLVALLEVHIKDDFTQEEQVMATAIRTGSMSLQDTKEGEKVVKERGSAIYAPAALGDPSRTGSVIRYCRAKSVPSTEDRAQEIVRLASFAEVFQTILRTIKVVNKFYKTNSTQPAN